MKNKTLSFVITLALLMSMVIPVSAVETVINNGKLRFGNGSESSINGTGGLQQPFYYNSSFSGWRQLTFSSYPLNYAVGVDGTTSMDAALSSCVIDTSSIISGSGEATATGELTVAGKLLGISHHYSLGASASYIKIVTTIQNKDAAAISGLKYWTGTQDDYVGGTDSPSKIKGNLVDGAFAELTDNNQQSKALKIYTGSESVLFFSTHDSAEMILNQSLGFQNIVDTDPRTSPYSMTGDDSYGMLLPLGNLAAGASTDFTWYYAAGTIAEIGNIIQDVADAAGQGSVTSITAVSAYLNYQSNVTGSAFALVKLASESAPDQATVVASGTAVSITAINTDFPISLTGLSENTQYKVYSVFQDGLNNLTAVDAEPFTTLDITAPNNASGYPTIASIATSSAVFKYKANEAGSIYTIIRKASESAPNKAAILAGTVNSIAAANTEYSFSLSSLLDSTEYVVYSVLKDSPGNSSDVTTTSFTTLDATAPLYSDGYPTMSAITASGGLFNYKTNEAGYVYTLVKLLSEEAPSKATVLASGTAITIVAADTEGSTSLDGLTADTEYKVYSVLKDSSENSSAVTETAFKTIVASRHHRDPVIPPSDTVLIINGVPVTIGEESAKIVDGETQVQLELDSTEALTYIESIVPPTDPAEQGQFIIPITNNTAGQVEVLIDEIVVEKLNEASLDIAIERGNIEYIIPSSELDKAKVMVESTIQEEDIQSIQYSIKIDNIPAAEKSIYEKAVESNGGEIVFPPISFNIEATVTKIDGTTETVKVNKFSSYVERIMELPEGVDPTKITTGIVFNEDGSYSHVPTDIFQKDGLWYAKLNSLTNSPYSVIYNPAEVPAKEYHWYNAIINDMAARLVLTKIDGFNPSDKITRAEFADYIVRALGLYRNDTEITIDFKDISKSDANLIPIQIAYQYKIISGYKDGTFRGDALISREEAMVMFNRAMKITGLNATQDDRSLSFNDFNSVGKWAASSVKEVLSAKVFNGLTATEISPKSNLTHAEALTAVRNLLIKSNLINDK